MFSKVRMILTSVVAGYWHGSRQTVVVSGPEGEGSWDEDRVAVED